MGFSEVLRQDLRKVESGRESDRALSHAASLGTTLEGVHKDTPLWKQHRGRRKEAAHKSIHQRSKMLGRWGWAGSYGTGKRCPGAPFMRHPGYGLRRTSFYAVGRIS